jgi:hypothetical protein
MRYVEIPAWVHSAAAAVPKDYKDLSPNTATCSMTTYFEVLTTSLATLTFIPFSSLTPKAVSLDYCSIPYVGP